MGRLKGFGECGHAAVRYNKKKEDGQEKVSSVRRSKCLLKFEHFFQRKPS